MSVVVHQMCGVTLAAVAARKKHPTYKKRINGQLDWSHLVQEQPSKTRY